MKLQIVGMAILMAVLAACDEQGSTKTPPQKIQPSQSPTATPTPTPTPTPTATPIPVASITPELNTGVFADGYIQGLSYKTKSGSGETNENGEFQYINGEEITFYYNDLSFGSTDASESIDFFTLLGSTAPDNEVDIRAILEQRKDSQAFQKVRRIVGVLAMFDTDLSPENGIDLDSMPASDSDFSFDFSQRKLDEFNENWYARTNEKLLRLSDIPFVYYYQALGIKVAAHALDTHQSFNNGIVYSAESHIINSDSPFPTYQQESSNYTPVQGTEEKLITRKITNNFDLATIDYDYSLNIYDDGSLTSTETNSYSFALQNLQKTLKSNTVFHNNETDNIHFEETTVFSAVGDILSVEKNEDTNTDGIYDSITKTQSVDIKYNEYNQVTTSFATTNELSNISTHVKTNEIETKYPFRYLNQSIADTKNGLLNRTHSTSNFDKQSDGLTMFSSTELIWEKALAQGQDFYYFSETWHYPYTEINRVVVSNPSNRQFTYTSYFHTSPEMLNKIEYKKTEMLVGTGSTPTSITRIHHHYDQELRLKKITHEIDQNLDGVFTASNITDVYIYNDSGLLSRIEEHEKLSDTEVTITIKQTFNYQKIDYGFAYLLKNLDGKTNSAGF